MTTHSHTQAILLKQLGIVPLVAKLEFFAPLSSADNALQSASTTRADSVVCRTSESKTELAENPRYQAILATQLAEDINALLTQTRLSDWQIDSLAKECQLFEQVLITPPLPKLQQVALKRQLWQLLSEQLHD